MAKAVETSTCVSCPRCESGEFAIELTIPHQGWWVECRNCGWVMGEITRKNLAEPKREGQDAAVKTD